MDKPFIKKDAPELINIEKVIKKDLNDIKSVLIFGYTMGMLGHFMYKNVDESFCPVSDNDEDYIYEKFPLIDPVNTKAWMFKNIHYIAELLKNNTNIYVVCSDDITYQYYNNDIATLLAYHPKYNVGEKIKKYMHVSLFKNNSVLPQMILSENMKFDVIIMNPPYDSGLYQKFISAAADMINDEMVIVSPMTWLFGKDPVKNICNKINNYNVDLSLIEPDKYFDANINSIMGITYVNKHTNGIFYNNKKFDSIFNIKYYSDDNVLLSILEKIGCANLQDNIHNHICKINKECKAFNGVDIKSVDDNTLILRLLALSGHSIARSRQIGEFYSVFSTSRKYEEHCGKFIDIKNKNKKELYYIPVNSENELVNIWNYLHTDFSILCLFFIKANLHIDSGELKYVPWMDFNESWNDLKLFKYYRLTKEEVEHIYEVIPNYHNNDRKYVLDHYEN